MRIIAMPERENRSIRHTLQSRERGRIASATWQDRFREGKGAMTVQSGVLVVESKGYNAWFEEGANGTGAEDLLAAAFASSFTGFIVQSLEHMGIHPGYLNTEVTIILRDLLITSVHLTVTGVVGGVSADEFARIVKDAEEECMISRVMKIIVSSEAKLVFETGNK